MKNKRAQFDSTKELIFIFIRLLIISMVFIVVVLSIDSGLRKNTDISETESFTLKNRIFYSDCITIEENNRIIPGTIDITKFTENTLNNCLENNVLGIKFTLNYNDINKIITINKEFTDQSSLCFDQDQVYCENKDYYVLVKENEELKRGILRMELTKLKSITK